MVTRGVHTRPRGLFQGGREMKEVSLSPLFIFLLLFTRLFSVAYLGSTSLDNTISSSDTKGNVNSQRLTPPPPKLATTKSPPMPYSSDEEELSQSDELECISLSSSHDECPDITVKNLNAFNHFVELCESERLLEIIPGNKNTSDDDDDIDDDDRDNDSNNVSDDDNDLAIQDKSYHHPLMVAVPASPPLESQVSPLPPPDMAMHLERLFMSFQSKLMIGNPNVGIFEMLSRKRREIATIDVDTKGILVSLMMMVNSSLSPLFLALRNWHCFDLIGRYLPWKKSLCSFLSGQDLELIIKAYHTDGYDHPSIDENIRRILDDKNGILRMIASGYFPPADILLFLEGRLQMKLANAFTPYMDISELRRWAVSCVNVAVRSEVLHIVLKRYLLLNVPSMLKVTVKEIFDKISHFEETENGSNNDNASGRGSYGPYLSIIKVLLELVPDFLALVDPLSTSKGIFHDTLKLVPIFVNPLPQLVGLVTFTKPWQNVLWELELLARLTNFNRKKFHTENDYYLRCRVIAKHVMKVLRLSPSPSFHDQKFNQLDEERAWLNGPLLLVLSLLLKNDLYNLVGITIEGRVFESGILATIPFRVEFSQLLIEKASSKTGRIHPLGLAQLLWYTLPGKMTFRKGRLFEPSCQAIIDLFESPRLVERLNPCVTITNFDSNNNRGNLLNDDYLPKIFFPIPLEWGKLEDSEISHILSAYLFLKFDIPLGETLLELYDKDSISPEDYSGILNFFLDRHCFLCNRKANVDADMDVTTDAHTDAYTDTNTDIDTNIDTDNSTARVITVRAFKIFPYFTGAS